MLAASTATVRCQSVRTFDSKPRQREQRRGIPLAASEKVEISKMAEAPPISNRTMAVKAILDCITPRWKAFLKQENLYEGMGNALDRIYANHSKDRNWHCAPKVQNMFQWMACPPRNVSAIVLLKEPLSTCDPEADSGQSAVEECLTVWKTIEILHHFRDMLWEESTKETMRERFEKGFDPRRLSERGIMFLNVDLGCGPTDDDSDIWWSFLEKLLSRIEMAAGVGKIAVLQMYNNNLIQGFLKGAEAKYATYRPEFIEVTGGRREAGRCQVKLFLEDDIKEFVNEIKKSKLLAKHRRVMGVMADAVFGGNQCSNNIEEVIEAVDGLMV